MGDFLIREATRDDCPRILALIKLANFEGLPDGPKIGPEVLQQDGFDAEHPLFKCFVAEIKSEENETPKNNSEAGDLVGYALYYNAYSTWRGKSLYLEDLYVTPEVRSKGVGSALFDRVVKVAADTGCCRMDFVVLNWNPAKEFYYRKGAIDMTDKEKWHYFRLHGNAFEALTNKKKNH